ncbi:MAG: glycosyltransferase family 4 protein [Solirubrobacterales bacterium]|nr:glycosyltransferase family 4 protein [Solirubrobacterales bacterium]
MGIGRGGTARVALVHDFLIGVRGAERVFFEICDLYPEADVLSPIYDEHGTEGRLSGRTVHTSFLQRLHPGRRTFRGLLPLYPAAIRSFDLSGYDLVISSSSAWAHAARRGDAATHVCYCHNPFRYAWNERDRTLAERRDPLTRAALGAFLGRWRDWDRAAARRVDRYVTNSRATQERIAADLGRESTVVYPPVETGRFAPAAAGEHYVLLSALMSHKRIELAVEAFNRLGRPLVIVGDGPDECRLRARAGPTVRFAGRVDDAAAAQLLATARAAVVTSVEEFGIAAVEAQAAGRPVIAAGAGGALETVVDGVTGRLWDGGADELAAAVADFDALAVDPAACVANARRFDRAVFREAFPREVDAALLERHGVGAARTAANGASNGHGGAGAQPPSRGTRIS